MKERRKNLKVPSLQHLARIWHPDPQRIKRTLVELVKNGPTFSYDPLHEFVRDMLVYQLPYEQIEHGVNRISRESVRTNFLGLLPLIRDYFAGESADFVHAVAPRYYAVGRGLMVPFTPPLVYGARGELHFPWLSFWRSNPLADKRLALFVTIVDDVLRQDPDLEDANFTILDFSAPSPRKTRQLRVVTAGAVERLTSVEVGEMLAIFVQGFELAARELAEQVSEGDRSERRDENQLILKL